MHVVIFVIFFFIKLSNKWFDVMSRSTTEQQYAWRKYINARDQCYR